MRPIRCLIVDDEPSAQKVLRQYIGDTDILELVETCNSAMDARKVISRDQVELILLDINMPKLSGISFLKTLQEPPAVVLTTAYDEYALEGYELNVVDYLLKPFSFERFLTAIGKVENRLQESDTAGKEYLVVKADRKMYKVACDEIRYIESIGDYVTIHYGDQSVTTYETLKNLEDRLPNGSFTRIHKSYIIAWDKIDYLEGNRFYIKEEAIPIGTTYKQEVVKRFAG